jgi:hypothetical protein
VPLQRELLRRFAVLGGGLPRPSAQLDEDGGLVLGPVRFVPRRLQQSSTCGDFTIGDLACPWGSEDDAQHKEHIPRFEADPGGWSPGSMLPCSESVGGGTRMSEDFCGPNAGRRGAWAVPAKGSVFNPNLVVQVQDWGATDGDGNPLYPGGSTGSPPLNWQLYAAVDADVATGGNYSSAMREDPAVRKNVLFQMYTSLSANNSGSCTIGEAMQEVIIFMARNTGAFQTYGGDNSETLIVDVINQPAADTSLTFHGGHVGITNGINYGPGPITFLTTGRVVVADMMNYGTVNFLRGKNTFLVAATNAAGAVVVVDDAAGALYQCYNEGTIFINNSFANLTENVNRAGGYIKVASNRI